jgi:hypothetical protein
MSERFGFNVSVGLEKPERPGDNRTYGTDSESDPVCPGRKPFIVLRFYVNSILLVENGR